MWFWRLGFVKWHCVRRLSTSIGFIPIYHKSIMIDKSIIFSFALVNQPFEMISPVPKLGDSFGMSERFRFGSRHSIKVFGVRFFSQML